MTIEATNLITPFIQGYKNLNEEWNHFFEIGLEDYLESQVEKYYFTNNFLHRHELIKFQDYYFPVKAEYETHVTTFNNLKDTFKKFRFIMLIGSAGSGKSTLTKHIFLNSISENFKIPLLIELRHLNDFDGDLEKLILDKIIKTYAAPSVRIAKRILKKGELLFLLDGYDEIFTDKKQKVNTQIESFVDSNSKNCYIITSRPGAGMECFSRFYNFKVLGLTFEDIENFVVLMVSNEERRQRLLTTIKDEKNQAYIHYLSNPLLLSMFILAFESHPEIPDKKSAFYKNVFDTLYSKHDGITKSSFPREKKTKLQRDDFENILSLFSYLSLIDKKIFFTEEYINEKIGIVKQYYKLKFELDDLLYDFVTSISIFIKEGFEFKFPHRSMQEYFAALFISKLPTDKKLKAYNNLMGVLENFGNDRSFNLEAISLEIDYYAFLNFFIIPKLKSLYNDLNFENEKVLMTAYIKMLKVHIYKFPKNTNYGIIRIASYNSVFLRYFKILNLKEISAFFDNDQLQEQLDVYYKNKKITGNLLPIKDKPSDILLKNGFITIINQLKESIEKHLIYFEESLLYQEENLNDILF